MRTWCRSLALLGLLGCISSDASYRLARELVLPYRSSVVAAAFADEVVVDQATIAAMRTITSRRQEDLRAVVQLQRGVHPYTVFSFTTTEHGTRAVATAMYWGDLEEKRVGGVPDDSVDRIIAAAVENLSCSTGPATETLFGPALVYWREGEQVTCQGPPWSEEGASLIEVVASLADTLQAIYKN